MFKYLSLPLFYLVTLSAGHAIPAPNVLSEKKLPPELEQWELLINEFLLLINLEELMTVIVGYLHDHEVINLAAFILSAEFKELLDDFLSIDEFEEINAYLESKGYDLQYLSDLINSLSKPKTVKNQMIIRKGINGLLQDLIATIPFDRLIEFFQSNLESNPEFAHLFETLNSEEFKDILRRIKENEKFRKLMDALASHGFSFQDMFELIKEFLGKD